MPNTLNMPEVEDLKIQGENQFAIDLKGEGIDVDELKSGKEASFEVDPSSVDFGRSNNGTYFDQELLFKQLNYECIDDGNDSSDEKSTPFDKIRCGMEDISGDGGVLKKIMKHGAGRVVPAKSLCRVHYNAYLEYSDEPFDSSRLRNRQHQFKLGSGESILGWELGVATMKRGETSRFMFTHNYAYGKMGCPPRIPPEAVCLFEIELISFVDQGASDDFENFSEEERKQASFDQILKVVEAIRVTGNEAFKMNRIGHAGGQYSQALRLLENANLKDEDEEKEMKKAALRLYLNISLCDLKQAKSGNACKFARKALDIDPKNVKALYRLARALRQLKEFNEAKRQISKAHRLEPSNKEVMEELRSLDKEIKEENKRQQILDKKMMSAFSRVESPKPKKVEEKFEENSQMLDLVIDRLKIFKNENTSPCLILPSNLTDTEMKVLEKIALDMSLFVTTIHEEGKKSIKISKTDEGIPYR